MSINEFQELGFTRLEQVIPLEKLKQARESICHIITKTAYNAGKEVARKIEQLDENRIPHEGLILLREKDPDFMRYAVDRMRCSAPILEIIYDPALRNFIIPYLGIDDHKDFGLGWEMLRADLPARFHKEQKRLSLPWHQESAYYKSRVSQKSSLVVWIPIFDCDEDFGCMELLEGSHKRGVIEHDSVYMDPENKRNLRFYAKEDLTSGYQITRAPAKAGDIVLNHFNTLHRSGQNISNDVRYTLLIRATHIFCEDFLP